MGLGHLPLELCQEVVGHIDAVADLYPLLFVSRILHSTTESRLYRDFPVELEQQRAECLRHLSRNPDISNRLRNLDLRLIAQWQFDPPRCGDDWKQILPDAFRALVNLKILYLPRYDDTCFVPPPNVEFRLEFLSCKLYNDEDRIEDSMISFLENQPKIETALLTGRWLPDQGEPLRPLPTTCFQGLVKLCCSHPIAQALIAARNIRALDVFGVEISYSWETIDSIPTLQCLHLYDVEALPTYTRHFPNLRYLEVSVESFSQLMPSGGETLRLEALQSLNAVVSVCADENEETNRIFDYFPSLQKIEFAVSESRHVRPELGSPNRVRLRGEPSCTAGRRRTMIVAEVASGWDESI